MYPKQLALIYEPDPVLRQIALPVTEFDDALKAFTKAMQKVMMNGNATHRGAGLAAPQVGVLRRIIAVEPGGAVVMVNPIFVPDGTTSEKAEGCLSCGATEFRVQRYHSGRVIYQTITGQERVEGVHGYRAQVIQHELDHLSGITLQARLEAGTATLHQETARG